MYSSLIAFVLLFQFPYLAQAEKEKSPENSCIYKAVQEVLEVEEDSSGDCKETPELTKLQMTRQRDTYTSYILTIRGVCNQRDSSYSVLTEDLPRKGCKITRFKM